jgi:hypothetical protein
MPHGQASCRWRWQINVSVASARGINLPHRVVRGPGSWNTSPGAVCHRDRSGVIPVIHRGIGGSFDCTYWCLPSDYRVVPIGTIARRQRRYVASREVKANRRRTAAISLVACCPNSLAASASLLRACAAAADDLDDLQVCRQTGGHAFFLVAPCVSTAGATAGSPPTRAAMTLV